MRLIFTADGEELDAEPLADLLERVDQIDSVPALQSYFGWSLRYGITSLWGCDVEADPGDPQRYVFFVAQDGIGLPDESYYREEQHAEILAEYGKHVARTLALAGLEDAEQQAADVVALEVAIAARARATSTGPGALMSWCACPTKRRFRFSTQPSSGPCACWGPSRW